MRPRTAILLAVGMLAASPGASPGATEETSPGAPGGLPRRTSPTFREITPEVRLAVDRGFQYLLRSQRQSGTFAGSDRFPIAVDALVGLAFLAGGHTDQEGPYTEAVRACLANVLSHQDSKGYFNDGQSRMYGHGFATLFLAELYGMTGDRAQTVRQALKRGVELIEKSQSTQGGWDYVPYGELDRQSDSDTSITVCQTMALRAARNLGIQVDLKVIEKARNFIRRAQNQDGGFRYRLNNFFGRESAFPRSAAGVCVLYSLAKQEEYSSDELRRGFEFLLRNYRSPNLFPYYGDYYCVQAMFQAGGRHWEEYYPYLREKLIQKQRTDGSWGGSGTEVTPQATAMALIALQVPLRFLPIFER